jgi:hypothetical protein
MFPSIEFGHGYSSFAIENDVKDCTIASVVWQGKWPFFLILVGIAGSISSSGLVWDFKGSVIYAATA